jgi:hypothetical protein
VEHLNCAQFPKHHLLYNYVRKKTYKTSPAGRSLGRLRGRSRRCYRQVPRRCRRPSPWWQRTHPPKVVVGGGRQGSSPWPLGWVIAVQRPRRCPWSGWRRRSLADSAMDGVEMLGRRVAVVVILDLDLDVSHAPPPPYLDLRCALGRFRWRIDPTLSSLFPWWPCPLGRW